MKNVLATRLCGAVLLLASVWLLSGTTGCNCGYLSIRLTPPAPGPCDISALLVDETVFPPGWEQQGPPSSKGAPVSFGVERRGVSFSTRSRGVAVQHVYRGTDARATSEAYSDFMSDFAVREGETEWVLPPGLTFESSLADQFRVGCSTDRGSGVQRCQFIAQYQAYLVRFHTYMSPDLMNFDDLERVLRDVDRRAGECMKE